MGHLFAHSEQSCNQFVRHLRREFPRTVRYKQGMKLRIKELRAEKGWTVEQLAERVRLSKSYVSEIENGKKVANQTRLQTFADVFDVHVIQLLDPETLGQDESALFDAFLKMKPGKRKTLISVAQGMSDE